MPGFSTLVVRGFAQLIADNGIGVWHPDGTKYAKADLGIYDTAAPEGADQLIALATYPLTDWSWNDSLVGLQVRTRTPGADPRTCRDLDDQIFDLLHGRHPIDLSTGIHITDCLRNSSSSLGLDESKRWSWTSNYYLTCLRPTPNRL